MLLFTTATKQVWTVYDFDQDAAVVRDQALTTRRNCAKMDPDMRTDMGFACDRAKITLREWTLPKAVRDTVRTWDDCLIAPCRDLWVMAVLHWYMLIATAIAIVFFMAFFAKQTQVVLARDSQDLRHLDLAATHRKYPAPSIQKQALPAPAMPPSQLAPAAAAMAPPRVPIVTQRM